MKNQEPLPKCPSCGSSLVVRNGHIHNGYARFACKVCRRQFVENPAWKPISDETKQLIDKLLLERLSLAAIARVCGVSKRLLPTNDHNASHLSTSCRFLSSRSTLAQKLHIWRSHK